MRLFPATKPFAALAIDILGPLPRTVEAAPQARAGKSELPRTAWLIPGVLMRSSACFAVPLSCIAVCVWC